MRDPDKTPRVTSQFRIYADASREQAGTFEGVASFYSRNLRNLDRHRALAARHLQLAAQAWGEVFEAWLMDNASSEQRARETAILRKLGEIAELMGEDVKK